MLKKYNQYIKENLTDRLVGPSDDEIIKNFNLDRLNPNELLKKSAEIGYLKGVKQALEKGADIHVDNDAPLLFSAMTNKPDIVEFLIKNGVNPKNDEILSIATSSYSTESLRILLENGADPNSKRMLSYMKMGLPFDVMEILIEFGADIHTENEAILKTAAYHGDEKVLKLLIDNGADIHNENEEALRLACFYGFYEVVKLLIDNGAIVDKNNIKIPRKNLNKDILELIGADNITEGLNDYLEGPTDDEVWEKFKDLKSQDLLIHSSQNGFIKGVKIAVEKLGKHKINSAFVIACMYDQLVLVEYCLANGADVHYKNDTALIDTCGQGNVSIVEYLLKRGANVHADNDEPLRNAIKFGNSNIVKILIDYGANTHARGNVFFNAARGNKKILDLLNDNDNINESLLDKMVGPTDEEVLKEIKKTCETDPYRGLILASENGFIEGIELAIKNGAKINDIPSFTFSYLNPIAKKYLKKRGWSWLYSSSGGL